MYFCRSNTRNMEQEKNLEKKSGRGGYRPNAGRKPSPCKKKYQLHVYVSAEFRKKVEDFAQSENKSVADFFRCLVEDYERRKIALEDYENEFNTIQ